MTEQGDAYVLIQPFSPRDLMTEADIAMAEKQKYIGHICSHQNRDGCRRWQNIGRLTSQASLYVKYKLEGSSFL